MNQDNDLERLLDHNSNDNAEFKGLKRAAALQSARRKIKLAQTDKFGRKRLLIVIVLALILIYFVNITWNEKQFYVTIPEDDQDWPGAKATNKSNLTKHLNDLQAVPKGFLVYSDGCQIPDYNPLASNVMKLFHKENYEDCIPNRKPITWIQRNYQLETSYLAFDETLKTKYYGSGKLKCCYQEITRSGVNKGADNHFNLSKCNDFQSNVDLPSSTEYILVKCKDSNNKLIYTNAHARIRRRPKIEERLENATNLKRENGTRPLSLLLIGIDSISRLNLIRAMPHTAQYLYNNQWFELKGYNKIDDNTFPNLMAILTGYNGTTAYHKCNPKSVGNLDKCPFIWRDFQDNGYTTAYGEDETKINTFNYNKYGFSKQPTDYYLRPFLLAAEKNLPIKYKSTLSFCLGYKTSADYIYEYAMDFAKTFKTQANFGLFWANTFSHNAISDPSSMDLKIKEYLVELETSEVLNNSMVIFFSDHGLRFGKIRELEIGWLEERLPFMFMWLPEWFQNQYPQYANNLRINRNRLTNPYDIHMTLKHIIELTNSTYLGKQKPAQGCPTCQSVFHEIPFNRSCVDANIAPHWCTCIPFKSFDKYSIVVKSATKFIINYINQQLLGDYLTYTTKRNATEKINVTSNQDNEENEMSENIVIAKGKYCAELKLKSVETVRRGIMEKEKHTEHYLIIFKTSPGDGLFETTLSYNRLENDFELTGSISRLNTFYADSACIFIDTLKKYCFCTNKPKSDKPK